MRSFSFAGMLAFAVVFIFKTVAMILWFITSITYRAFPSLGGNFWWHVKRMTFTFAVLIPVAFVFSLHRECSIFAFAGAALMCVVRL